LRIWKRRASARLLPQRATARAMAGEGSYEVNGVIYNAFIARYEKRHVVSPATFSLRASVGAALYALSRVVYAQASRAVAR